jgi:hypothetical protein
MPGGKRDSKVLKLNKIGEAKPISRQEMLKRCQPKSAPFSIFLLINSSHKLLIKSVFERMLV